jgi:uncharacterized protein (TIGR03118 family)
MDTVKRRVAFYFVSFFLLRVLLVADNATAQTIGYRQTNLASNVPNVANGVVSDLVDPWGIAFLSDQPFFLADNQVGRVTAHDANGLGTLPGSFTVPNSAGTGFDTPTGIVADQNSFFGSPSLLKPFILVTDQGTIFTWGPDARGNLPRQATLMVNNSARNAVYKGVAILDSSLTAPALAVTDFRGGFIDTFLPGFAPVALPGSFTDPNLTMGYAPFGIQVIGKQVFVAYALQDAAKHDPVAGAGNGIVNIFDMDGNFVRRFATGGALNVPWGIAKASANFGPFSNDLLIGNVGDGTINAFDPATGRFLGKLIDGDGNDITEVGLHALAFRSDGLGNPDTLYFTSEFSNERDGLFGAITTGLVSAVRVSAPDSTVDQSITITANVAAGPGNPGDLTGMVTFLDGAIRLGNAPLLNGSAAINAAFGAGVHNITALYSGDGAFLPSSGRIPLEVTGIATMSALLAPATAAPGSAITLTATTTSAGGIPTGQVAFLDGATNLGTASLNGAGVATLRVNTLAVGTHSLASSYAGDEKFAASKSAAVTIVIANADFSLAATPSTATVIAGRSTQFMLSVVPSGGFANSVAFSCTPVTGVTCNFNPAAVTTTQGAASTMLTVTTSANVTHFGLLMAGLVASWTAVLAAMGLLSLAMRCARSLPYPRRSQFALAITAIVMLGLAIGGCGGYGSSSQVNRGTATINVVAQSGAISHTTTVSVTVQ